MINVGREILQARELAKENKQKVWNRKTLNKRNWTFLPADKFKFFISPPRPFKFKNNLLMCATANQAESVADLLVKWNTTEDEYTVLECIHAGNPGKMAKATHKVVKSKLKEWAESNVLMRWSVKKTEQITHFNQSQILVRHVPTNTVMANWADWKLDIYKIKLASDQVGEKFLDFLN